ncbi:3'-5' exonuclease [Acinetobacter modestus]|uniref:3'-5' exonuclease n=1 Tax=Acinetobacter modestus TaxID=1776740 RepID=UPI00301623EA
MNRLMIDFETLDVAECPVILSMGAVVFNENGIVDCLVEKIDQHSCLDLGCTVSIDTALWWEEQSNEAKKAAFGGTTNIGYAMGMLVDFYNKHECQEIWSKGSLADIRWTNNILIKLNLKKPWKFSREMCFRTYLKYSPKVDFQPTGEAHNALDDAINQALQFILIEAVKVNQTDHHRILIQRYNELGDLILKKFDDSTIANNVEIPVNKKEIDRLNQFVSDVLDIEGIEIEDIKQLARDNGFICKLVGGDNKHGSYTIFKKFKAYSVAITKCHCGHIHLLEDMCVECNPDLKDNFLGNGTPIAAIELNENDLPF